MESGSARLQVVDEDVTHGKGETRQLVLRMQDIHGDDALVWHGDTEVVGPAQILKALVLEIESVEVPPSSIIHVAVVALDIMVVVRGKIHLAPMLHEGDVNLADALLGGQVFAPR